MRPRPTKRPRPEAELTAAAARDAALRLLGRREHSRRELERKLGARGFAEAVIEEALDGLYAERLANEDRFAESYVRARAVKGYGPVRIRGELAERGVSGAQAEAALAQVEIDWGAQARLVRAQRFGAGMPEDFPERAKQMRFLEYRGFDHGQIRGAFRDDGDE